MDYYPHQAQQIVHRSEARNRVVSAGRRWGKSTSLAAHEAFAQLCVPNSQLWVVAPTYDLADKVFRVVWKLAVVQNHVPGGIRKASERERYIWTNNDARITGKTADDPTGLVGEGLDAVIVDEAARIPRPQLVWQECLRPALSDRQGWSLFISTPRGYNAFYEWWQWGQSSEMPNWASFRHPSWTNPFLAKSEIEDARRELSVVRYEQEFGAQFRLHEGLVFPEFDEEKHVVNTTWVVPDLVGEKKEFERRVEAEPELKHYEGEGLGVEELMEKLTL